MKVLLINPEFPDTFWSFKRALEFVGKKTVLPPLGLLTVAAMLPPEWGRRLVDLNIRSLSPADLAWADMVLVTAMAVQRESSRRAIDACKRAGLRVVAGGPLYQSEDERIAGVDHYILNEAEITLPPFLEDLARGEPRRIYETREFADLRQTPVPDWSLLDLKHYGNMSIQFSRGCPFSCDFCNVTALLGHGVRVKTTEQILKELDLLYGLGWRGEIFFVDDNFIGNKRVLRTDLLPALIRWRGKKRGVQFFTEASINLAEDLPLMEQMVRAGFTKVFIGIETPDEHCLAECSKIQNRNRDLIADVKTIQRAGLQVQGGFIVGFDKDQPSIFQRQIDFIQKSGIVTAMVGLLQAPPGTRLYERLLKEGRLRGKSSGDNVDGTTNIVPAMNLDLLRAGYKRILAHIYAPEHYYRRVRTFLREYRAPKMRVAMQFSFVLAFFRAFFRLGIVGKERVEYWRLILWTQFRRPRLVPLAIVLAINGYHFRKTCETHVT